MTGLTSKEALPRPPGSDPTDCLITTPSPSGRLLESIAERLQLVLIAVGILYAVLGELEARP